MKRILKLLVAAALMLVLMSTYVSPAFAAKPSWASYGGYKVGLTGTPVPPEYTGVRGCSWGYGGLKSGCD